MAFSTDLKAEFNKTLEYGNKLRFRYFVASGAGYDDDVVLAQSGVDVWTSGLICPIDDKRGSYDAVLIEQGKVQINDRKVYLLPEIQTSGIWRMGVGSPSTREYALTEGGVITWEVQDTLIYKKAYVKQLPLGSLIGE